MPLLLRYAARNLARHRWRSLATVLGIALGIAAVLATLSIGDSVRVNLAASLEIASGDVDLVVVPGAGGRAVFFEQPVRDELVDVARIDAFRPVLEVRAEPLRDESEVSPTVIPGLDSGFVLSGRDVSRANEIPASIAAGRYPDVGERAIALAATFAEARGLALGSELAFATRAGERRYRIVGLLDGANGIGSSNAGRVAIAPLDVLRGDARLDGRVTSVELRTHPDVDVPRLRDELTSRLGDSYLVTTPAASGTAATGIVDTLQAGLLVLASTLLALGGFMAYNTFAASAVERRREYALLRTICLRRRDVQRVALVEAGIVSVVGAAVGIALGFVLAWGLTRVNALVLGLPAHGLVVPTRAVAIATAVGVAVALVAAVLPARAASRTPPLAALRSASSNDADASSTTTRALGATALGLGSVAAFAPWAGLWTLVGSAAAMALFFVGITLLAPDILRSSLRALRPAMSATLGVAGRLGADFANRNAARNGVAIGTMIVGVSLIIGVGAMVAGINDAIDRWVRTTVAGDLFVTGPVGFPDDFALRVASFEGVDAVSGVALRVVRFEAPGEPRGRSVALILVDPGRFDPSSGFASFQFLPGQGSAARGHEALVRGDVLAGTTLHERYGVDLGDEVRLRTRDGFATFGVGGVIVDFTGGGEAFVASIDALERFGGGSPDLFVLTVEDDVAPADVRRRIDAAFPDLGLDITSTQAYQQRILDASQRSFATTNALLVLAVVIAALGVANTLGMNLAARQHEIAVLRTLGLSRRGVRRVVLAESVVVVVVGTAIGIVVGLLLSRIVTAGAATLTGYVLEPVYPWHLPILALGLAPAIGILASLLPARRAARLAPIDALRGPA